MTKNSKKVLDTLKQTVYTFKDATGHYYCGDRLNRLATKDLSLAEKFIQHNEYRRRFKIIEEPYNKDYHDIDDFKGYGIY